MPALLNTTSNFPKLSSANRTIPSASDAFETSAAKARALSSPIEFAVASAASFFTSTTTTFAPSRANRRHDAFPIPEPPPVINATLFAKRICSSRLLEVSLSFPVGDCGIELPLFGAEKVEIVLDDVAAQDFACPFAATE